MHSAPEDIKRIAILFTELSGYTLACWRELKARYGVELLVFYHKPIKDAPFELSLDFVDHLYPREGHSPEQIDEIVSKFNPQGICIAGWRDRGYMGIARKLKAKGVPVVATLDNQWRGDFRQRLGVAASPYLLHKSIDILWVAGERQAQFAKKLGYVGAKCWYGLYCCDWEKFENLPSSPEEGQDNAFLYVGKYNSHEKAVEVLVEAYRLYRKKVANPWKLLCAGTGDLKPLLQQQEGVVDLGFTQPDALPDLMRNKASAFILPSRKDAWGVVLQEAAASGLPLICSDACGASVHLLQNGYNGFLFDSGNAETLARSMEQMTRQTPSQLHEMGVRSYELAKQFKPQRWADTLINGISNFSRA